MMSGLLAVAASSKARSEPLAIVSADKSMRTASRWLPEESTLNSTPNVGGEYLTPTFAALDIEFEVKRWITLGFGGPKVPCHAKPGKSELIHVIQVRVVPNLKSAFEHSSGSVRPQPATTLKSNRVRNSSGSVLYVHNPHRKTF
jgi:hypothetical protein